MDDFDILNYNRSMKRKRPTGFAISSYNDGNYQFIQYNTNELLAKKKKAFFKEMGIQTEEK